RPRAARRTAKPVSTRTAARHDGAELADRADPDRAGRPCRLRKPGGTRAAERRARDERFRLQTYRRGVSARPAPGPRLARRRIVQRADRAGRRDLPSFAAHIPSLWPRAQDVPDQTPDARAWPAGGQDLEESHPRHQPRIEQLTGADLVARAFRA